MTITSCMLGVCVPPEEAPTEVRDFVDITALYSDDRPSSVSLSRWVIASQHLDRLLEAYEANELFYLREMAAVLDPPAIPPKIQALERLFAQIRDDTGRAMACATWECTAQQLIDAAMAPEVTPIPEDPQDEDGESLQHAIAYLKAHTVVLRHAQEQGMRVLHGRSHNLDGTEAREGPR